MSKSKHPRWLGPVRLQAFKACAKTLGRALGVPHSHSLEALARACGWMNYWDLLNRPDPRGGAGSPRVRPEQEVYDLWCRQVAFSFGLQDRTSLDAVERLPTLFQHLLVRQYAQSPVASEQAQEEEEQPAHLQDPMLRAGDWRDAEFRQWLGGLVGRTSSQGRGGISLPTDGEIRSLEALQEVA
jgi:hypothetical protein